MVDDLIPHDENKFPIVDLHGYTEEEFIENFCNWIGKQVKRVICVHCECKEDAIGGSKFCENHK